MSETIASYADLAVTLPSPHGPDHDCLVCADMRQDIGHIPLTPEFYPWSVGRSPWSSVLPDAPTGEIVRILTKRYWPTESGRALAGQAS